PDAHIPGSVSARRTARAAWSRAVFNLYGRRMDSVWNTAGGRDRLRVDGANRVESRAARADGNSAGRRAQRPAVRHQARRHRVLRDYRDTNEAERTCACDWASDGTDARAGARGRGYAC